MIAQEPEMKVRICAVLDGRRTLHVTIACVPIQRLSLRDAPTMYITGCSVRKIRKIWKIIARMP